MPPGDARDLVRAAGTGLVCGPSDVAGTAQDRRPSELAALRRRETSPQVDRELLLRYTRPHLAAKLAALLDDVSTPHRPLGRPTPRAEMPAAGAGGRSA